MVVVGEKHEPPSYDVRTQDGAVFRRNCVQLKAVTSGPVNTPCSLLPDSEEDTDLDDCEVSKGEEKSFQLADLNLR